jgi:hypothetical protein
MSESEIRLEALKLAKEFGVSTPSELVANANVLADFVLRGELTSERVSHPEQSASTRSM